MMRRIDLLPESYLQGKKDRKNLSLVIVAGVVVLALLGFWWFTIGGQIKDAEAELAAVKIKNEQLQAQIDELQQFAALEAEVQAKRTALQTVFVGDVDWPALMTELAMVVPGEVWLEGANASVGPNGSVGTEGNTIDVDTTAVGIGRISFTGKSLTMPGVAKWLIRLGTTKEFLAAWLSGATRGTGETALDRVVSFTSTVELGPAAASDRFQGRELR